MKTEIQKEYSALNKKAANLENKINAGLEKLSEKEIESLYAELSAVQCKLQSSRFTGQKNLNAVDCEVSIPQFAKGRNIS